MLRHSVHSGLEVSGHDLVQVRDGADEDVSGFDREAVNVKEGLHPSGAAPLLSYR